MGSYPGTEAQLMAWLPKEWLNGCWLQIWKNSKCLCMAVSKLQTSHDRFPRKRQKIGTSASGTQTLEEGLSLKKMWKLPWLFQEVTGEGTSSQGCREMKSFYQQGLGRGRKNGRKRQKLRCKEEEFWSDARVAKCCDTDTLINNVWKGSFRHPCRGYLVLMWWGWHEVSSELSANRDTARASKQGLRTPGQQPKSLPHP